MTDKRNWLILILGLVCGILLWIQFGSDPVILGEDVIRQRLDSLAGENARLNEQIACREEENRLLWRQNDSLSGLEAEIETRFDTIYESIHNLPADALAREFERIFAENHID